MAGGALKAYGTRKIMSVSWRDNGVQMTTILVRVAACSLFGTLLLTLGGCAVGNRYDYGNAISGLPISGTGKLAVDVVDARPYVVNGDKKPDFVGLQRGGFGNPFDVRTGSGRPLATEMRDAISNALQKQGYAVVGATEAAPRKMELRIFDWKTDVMMKMKTIYDLQLTVFDGRGVQLAQSKAKGEDVGSGGFESGNAVNAARTFELRFTELLRDEAVRNALTKPAP
jgi:hypothetical protein